MSDTGPDSDPFKIEFPAVGPENLIELGEDLSRAFSTYRLTTYSSTAKDRKYISSISKTVSRARASPMGPSSEEAAALAKTFREGVSVLSSPTELYFSSHLWLRLYAHALLRESRIFPNVELYDESPAYAPKGVTDVWRGDYNGEPVCFKVIRVQNPEHLRETGESLRCAMEGIRQDPHPNVLPVIEVSQALFPLCIVTPWIQDGNITQYARMNPDVNRLTLLAQACHGLMYLHGLGVLHGSIAPNNILITRDGHACLGDFGIGCAVRGRWYDTLRLETIRYMAPERFWRAFTMPQVLGDPSKGSDVYSLAMTSFSVLTGILPYGNRRGRYRIERQIRNRERPPRPTKLGQNRWLQDPVWDVITTGWHHKPEERCELSVMCHAFSPSGHQEVVGAGDLNSRNDDAPGIEAGPEENGKILPLAASFFPFMQDSGSEIERRISEMDKRLEGHTLSDRERLKLFNELCKTCSRYRVIPRSMHISDCSENSIEVECGGFANVSKSTYEGRRVAIKVVRMYVTSDLDVILSRFCREGVAWKHLRHPNILPLLGVTINEYQFAMVSEWMENGDINRFVESDRHVNRTELLVDVANGLKYMHDLHIVHGDLKGANILINKDRRACLADFGLSTITGVAAHAAAGASLTSLISNDTLMSFTGGGTRRWMSPELLHPERLGVPESEGDRPTRQSDCYALGMVIYEVLCGHHPYLEFQSDILATNAIMEGVRPRKPEEAKRLGFSDELWKTVELCWLEDRNTRPSVKDILSCINDAAAFWCTRES